MQRMDPETLDGVVSQSVQEYEEIYLLLLTFGQQLESHGPDDINKFHDSLAGLQRVAQRTDRKLIEQLTSVTNSDTVAEKIDNRFVLQQKILALLKETGIRASSIKSLLASEMQAIKHGRRALSGYKSNSAHQGKIVDKKS